MNKKTLLFGLWVLLMAGCGATLRVRLDAPVGSVLTVRNRGDLLHLEEQEDQVVLSVPFIAAFETGDDSFSYPVTLVLPPEVALRYGGAGEARLSGELHVYPPTRATGADGIVTVEIPEARLRSLLRGEVALVETSISDPNELGQRYLVRLVLRATLR